MFRNVKGLRQGRRLGLYLDWFDDKTYQKNKDEIINSLGTTANPVWDIINRMAESGTSRKDIGKLVKLTPQRVGQIINEAKKTTTGAE